ncbi:MAG: hypothetical protein WBV94_04345 [Blastocatellia bacterium]
MYDQQTIIEVAGDQWLVYIEALFSAYTEFFMVLSVIVLISIAVLCVRETRGASKRGASKLRRQNGDNAYLSAQLYANRLEGR